MKGRFDMFNSESEWSSNAVYVAHKNLRFKFELKLPLGYITQEGEMSMATVNKALKLFAFTGYCMKWCIWIASEFDENVLVKSTACLGSSILNYDELAHFQRSYRIKTTQKKVEYYVNKKHRVEIGRWDDMPVREFAIMLTQVEHGDMLNQNSYSRHEVEEDLVVA